MLRPKGITEASKEQAVLVFLAGTSPQARIYTPQTLAPLEEALSAALMRLGVGEFDGDEIGLQSGNAVLYLYGPDAEVLFSAIEEILRLSPLCNGARVVLRKGGPGSLQREIRI